MPSAKAALPDEHIPVPVPATLDEALVDSTSIVSIFLKCRQDMHDEVCDFSSVKPLAPSLTTATDYEIPTSDQIKEGD